jgi:hypothetical protein
MSSPAPAPAPAPKSLSKATSMTFNGPPGASPTVRRRVPKPLPSLPDDGWGAARDLRTARAGGALPSPATATAAVFAIPPLPAVPPSLMVFDDPETSSPRTPVRPSHRFTRSLGSLVGLDEMPSPARMPKPVLPLNPAVWTRELLCTS